VVAELNAAVVDWCAGPLAEVCGAALADPRVAVVVADVAREIAAGAGCFDAIVLDLYDGPSRREDEPFFGRRALRLARQALRAGGVLAVWGEEPCPSFERRLAAEGFTAVEHQRHGRGGRKHSVYTATAGERARRRSPGKGKRG